MGSLKDYSVKLEGFQFLTADVEVEAATPEEAAAKALEIEKRGGALDWEFTSRVGVPVDESVVPLVVTAADGEEWEPPAVPNPMAEALGAIADALQGGDNGLARLFELATRYGAPAGGVSEHAIFVARAAIAAGKGGRS